MLASTCEPLYEGVGPNSLECASELEEMDEDELDMKFLDIDADDAPVWSPMELLRVSGDDRNRGSLGGMNLSGYLILGDYCWWKGNKKQTSVLRLVS